MGSGLGSESYFNNNQKKKRLERRLKSRECISFRTKSKCISVNIFGIIWANILALDSKSGKFGNSLVLDCSTKRAYENLFLFLAGVGAYRFNV